MIGSLSKVEANAKRITELDARARMEILALSYMKSEKVFEFIARNKSMRGCMVWGGRLNHLRLEVLSYEEKMSFWEESGKYGLTKDERIDYCRALYYLAYVSTKLI